MSVSQTKVCETGLQPELAFPRTAAQQPQLAILVTPCDVISVFGFLTAHQQGDQLVLARHNALGHRSLVPVSGVHPVGLLVVHEGLDQTSGGDRIGMTMDEPPPVIFALVRNRGAFSGQPVQWGCTVPIDHETP